MKLFLSSVFFSKRSRHILIWFQNAVYLVRRIGLSADVPRYQTSILGSPDWSTTAVFTAALVYSTTIMWLLPRTVYEGIKSLFSRVIWVSSSRRMFIFHNSLLRACIQPLNRFRPCRLKRSKIRVILGDHDQYVNTDGVPIMRAVSVVIRHRNFDMNSYNHDVALLKLRKSVKFSKRIRPICLPQPGSVLLSQYINSITTVY